MKTKFIFSIILVAICYFLNIQTSSAQFPPPYVVTTYMVSVPNAPANFGSLGYYIQIGHTHSENGVIQTMWTPKYYFTSNTLPSFEIPNSAYSGGVVINTNLPQQYRIPTTRVPYIFEPFRCFTISYLPNGIAADPCGFGNVGL